MANTYIITAIKREIQSQTRRSKHKYEGNIKIGVKNYGDGVWDGLIWLTIETTGGLFEHRDETSVSIKKSRFLEQLKAPDC